MKVQGNHRFGVARERLWEALQSPDVLSKIVPGFERLEAVGDNEFEGALQVKVGPVQGRFDGRVEMSDLTPPESYHMALKGKGKPGFVDGSGRIELTEESDETTVLDYDFDLNVGGRIAGVGQRLLDSASRAFTKEALENLEKQVTVLAEAEASGEAPPELEAPSQTAFAASVAKEMASDLVPKKYRPVLAVVGLAILVLLIWLIMRSCG